VRLLPDFLLVFPVLGFEILLDLAQTQIFGRMIERGIGRVGESRMGKVLHWHIAYRKTRDIFSYRDAPVRSAGVALASIVSRRLI
jgi:hypothetical protein